MDCESLDFCVLCYLPNSSSTDALFFPQVLVRLVGADDHIYPNFMDVMQWLADSNLLEMILDKLSSSVSFKWLTLFFF